MNHAFRLAALCLVLSSAGCAPKEQPPESAVPGSVDARLQRELWFGPDIASAKDIEWRSSGLGIRIIVPGTGSPPTPVDRVRVHYSGRLKDGTVFDDTRARGKPADFTVHQLITGWAAAMSSLKPGGKAEFYIPPKLGYGDTAVGRIPPSSGLIFNVELIAVNPAD
jgi:FKBP-type peptidyl-prolyl cis-trans isomerase